MKNIKLFYAPKYETDNYKEVEPGIYEKDESFYLSISFTQETKMGEGSSAADISQYPVEDILEKYFVHVSDFYSGFNTDESETCYLEFGSPNIQRLKQLKEIIGKHIYNKEYNENGNAYVQLIIE